MSGRDLTDVPLFCPVCDCAMNVDTDLAHFLTSEACFDCTIKYFEVNRDKWKQGWRPDLKDAENRNSY